MPRCARSAPTGAILRPMNSTLRLPARHTLALLTAAMAAGLSLPPAQATEPTPSACADFYGHINGQWISSTELPADRARIGSFDQLAISNTRQLIRSLDKLLADPKQQNTPGLQLLAAWYGSALDPATAKAAGLKPAQPLLQRKERRVHQARGGDDAAQDRAQRRH